MERRIYTRSKYMRNPYCLILIWILYPVSVHGADGDRTVVHLDIRRGAPVFSGQTRQELLRQIADQEPIPLRRLDPRLPVELETVVLKALAKNASERYASAHELADDLQRYLDDRPILARRPRIAEKLVRWQALREVLDALI